MAMLKQPKNKMAFAKVGIYGEAASGKTFTAALIAIGLWKYAKCQKPIGMFDTEPAASFIIPLFEKEGIPFLVYDESRALKDLMSFMDEAEKECSIVIIDSITHVWRDAQDSYLKKINDQRKKQRKDPLFALEFHHWKHIKGAWQSFTDRFLSSKLHVIVCGRSGSIYEYQKSETTGKMELITVGTKMATEKELGYEPSLLIEMIKHREKGRIINRALVEKDRSNTINGLEIDKPTFADFKKHFEALNIGGEHFGNMSTRDSQELYEDCVESSGWDAEKRTREILLEQIQNLFIKSGIGNSSMDDKKKRIEYLGRIFGTDSWTEMETLKSDALKVGLDQLKISLEGLKCAA